MVGGAWCHESLAAPFAFLRQSLRPPCVQVRWAVAGLLGLGLLVIIPLWQRALGVARTWLLHVLGLSFH